MAAYRHIARFGGPVAPVNDLPMVDPVMPIFELRIGDVPCFDISTELPKKRTITPSLSLARYR